MELQWQEDDYIQRSCPDLDGPQYSLFDRIRLVRTSRFLFQTLGIAVLNPARAMLELI